MRIIVYTGKGGVGKSSIACATAVLNAGRGRRTLLVSSDLAHNLSDILGSDSGLDNLTVLEIDILAEINDNWQAVSEYFAGFLAYLGLDDVVAEEVALLPGIDAFFMLTRILREIESDAYDTIVIDCPPTAGTFRLLTFTNASSNTLNKFISVERKILKLVRPLSRRVKSMRNLVPEDDFYECLGDVIEDIGRLGELLRDPAHSTFRLVLNPDRIAVAETRRSFTYMGLFGFPVDAIMVNKVLPEDVEEGYFQQWRHLQREQLAEIEQAFLECRLFRIRYLEREPAGIDELGAFGEEIFGDIEPDVCCSESRSVKFSRQDGRMTLKLFLPNLDKAALDLGRKENELIIRATPYHRVLTLPDSLAGVEIEGAAYEDGNLAITFGEG
ncbi:MAG: ArsA family ATPase [Lentisphaeria bacterium]|nr:ArsA family ATPase [Lentisphaeria bacterium]